MSKDNDTYPLPTEPNDVCFDKNEFIKVLRIEAWFSFLSWQCFVRGRIMCVRLDEQLIQKIKI